MSKFIKPAVVALAVVMSTAALAQQAQPKPENLIKWRQSAYQVLGWNSSRIKASVEGTYNKEEVIKAANTIVAIANSGLGSLFPPGTEQGKGWHDTGVKPELFKDGNKVAERAANFTREATELARLAAIGDAATVKVQFGNLAKACKACHDDFKFKDL
jgi:cytochrome c556